MKAGRTRPQFETRPLFSNSLRLPPASKRDRLPFGAGLYSDKYDYYLCSPPVHLASQASRAREKHGWLARLRCTARSRELQCHVRWHVMARLLTILVYTVLCAHSAISTCASLEKGHALISSLAFASYDFLSLALYRVHWY